MCLLTDQRYLKTAVICQLERKFNPAKAPTNDDYLMFAHDLSLDCLLLVLCDLSVSYHITYDKRKACLIAV